MLSVKNNMTIAGIVIGIVITLVVLYINRDGFETNNEEVCRQVRTNAAQRCGRINGASGNRAELCRAAGCFYTGPNPTENGIMCGSRRNPRECDANACIVPGFRHCQDGERKGWIGINNLDDNRNVVPKLMRPRNRNQHNVLLRLLQRNPLTRFNDCNHLIEEIPDGIKCRQNGPNGETLLLPCHASPEQHASCRGLSGDNTDEAPAGPRGPGNAPPNLADDCPLGAPAHLCETWMIQVRTNQGLRNALNICYGKDAPNRNDACNYVNNMKRRIFGRFATGPSIRNSRTVPNVPAGPPMNHVTGPNVPAGPPPNPLDMTPDQAAGGPMPHQFNMKPMA